MSEPNIIPRHGEAYRIAFQKHPLEGKTYMSIVVVDIVGVGTEVLQFQISMNECTHPLTLFELFIHPEKGWNIEPQDMDT